MSIFVLMNPYYKFLDMYVGDTFSVKEVRSVDNHYHIISNNGIFVISFMVRGLGLDNPGVTIFRSDRLCDTVKGFFVLTDDESMKIVRDWFGNKLGLKRTHDLLDLIPNEKEYVYEQTCIEEV